MASGISSDTAFWHNAPMQTRALAIIGWLAVATATANQDGAPGTYVTPDAFVARTFAHTTPQAKLLWFDDELKSALADVLGHPPNSLRTRYWHDGDRSAWILDEIGKDRPITMGVVVANDAIESLDVLVFRESRGWEIKHAFFTDQFRNARLDGKYRLTPPVDGITGATLSVRAAKRVAAAALVLHRHVIANTNEFTRGPTASAAN